MRIATNGGLGLLWGKKQSLKYLNKLFKVEESSKIHIEIGRHLHSTVYSDHVPIKLRGRESLAAIANAELMEVKIK